MNSTTEPMRSFDEIQKAHDILWMVVMEDTFAARLNIGEEARDTLQATLSALCWVLRHDEHEQLSRVLSQIETAANEASYQLKRFPEGEPPP